MSGDGGGGVTAVDGGARDAEGLEEVLGLQEYLEPAVTYCSTTFRAWPLGTHCGKEGG